MKYQKTPLDKYGALLEASVWSTSTEVRAPIPSTGNPVFLVPTKRNGPEQDVMSFAVEVDP